MNLNMAVVSAGVSFVAVFWLFFAKAFRNDSLYHGTDAPYLASEGIWMGPSIN